MSPRTSRLLRVCAAAVGAFAVLTVVAAGCAPRRGGSAGKPSAPAPPATLPRTAQSGPFQVRLSIAPTPPVYLTDTRFTLDVEEAGKPVRGASVRIEIVMDHPMPKNEVTLSETAPGTYVGTGAFAMGGDNEARVTLKKGGAAGTARFLVRNVAWQK